jgi:hypothetical protein
MIDDVEGELFICFKELQLQVNGINLKCSAKKVKTGML